MVRVVRVVRVVGGVSSPRGVCFDDIERPIQRRLAPSSVFPLHPRENNRGRIANFNRRHHRGLAETTLQFELRIGVAP